MKLTCRQTEIAELAAVGLPNKLIASQLGITEGTVKLHIHEVFARLGINSRTVLAARWRLEKGNIDGNAND
jgi:DNA-binding NarL/FixJ family response regulator